MLRSTGARLAALYTAGFAVAVLALGATTLLTTRAALRSQFEARLRSEADALTLEYRTEGVDALKQAVGERDGAPGSLEYGLRGPGGAIVGRLAHAHTPLGWSTLRLSASRSEGEAVTVYTQALPGGYRLLLGDASDRGEALSHLLLQRFALALGAVVAVGALGGYGLTVQLQRRIAAMDAAAQAIIEGDLARRIPVGREADDLDRLAATLNRMLDRIEALMESLRQVSVDIAHDLRTPLTRLRQRLEAALPTAGGGEHEATLDGALADLDAILGTFGALLRIAQIDSGSRRAGFRPVDLGSIAATVVEAFAPSAEDLGRRLTLTVDKHSVTLLGDGELLTQLIVNLVENAIRHAGPLVAILVSVAVKDGTPTLRVTDNGCGVPSHSYDQLFNRFFRLERSRSTPGDGLGLALVAAIARLHEARIELRDARPGLDVTIHFPTIGVTRAEVAVVAA